MTRTLIVLALLAAASPAAASDETPFEPSTELFADAKACRAHLERTVTSAQDYEVVRGPYVLTDGDVRVHLVRAEGNGHRIWEHRCVDKVLSSRTWNHSMAAADEDFTVESVARTAEWLKKGAPKKEQ